LSDRPAYPSFDLTGQVALVTGAGRGIGEAVAATLARAGASVSLAARSVDELKAVAAQIEAEDARTYVVGLDVTDLDSIEHAVASTLEQLGRLDILVNNAGTAQYHDALTAAEHEWDRVMSVNLKGAFFTAQAAARVMIERGYGRIVNIGSQGGHVGFRRCVAYCASKGGLEQMTRVCALEWAAHGVTVNVVAPTFIRTPLTEPRLAEPGFLEGVLARIPVGRVGIPADIAAAVLYLASPAAGLVTGSVLSVDGGWTAQ
jgi:NAD(P)-dependent dehydrogenase (short-subunit alcohol dehydrogenase family)